jgi:ABC-type dipeptide/oligopeptide/nickel transport system permease subunit
MSAIPSIRRLSRAARLQCWVVAALGLLWAAPFVFRAIADKSAAYGIRVEAALQAPTSHEWFGTDASGRSQWHRTLIATAISLRVVSGSLLLALPLSLILGALAGAQEGRWPDHLIGWLIALLHTVPFFLLVVAVAALLGPGTGHLPWLIGGIIWAPAARLVRAETIRLIESHFVIASRASGQSSVQIFFRSLFPLTTIPVTIALFYLVPEIIGVDAILALFGLGPQPPTPSLGGLIFEGVRRWDAAPWLAGLPCVLLIMLCLGIHFLADRIAFQLKSTS